MLSLSLAKRHGEVFLPKDSKRKDFKSLTGRVMILCCTLTIRQCLCDKRLRDGLCRKKEEGKKKIVVVGWDFAFSATTLAPRCSSQLAALQRGNPYAQS